MGPENTSSPSVWPAFLGTAPPRMSSSSLALSDKRVSSPPLSEFLGLFREVAARSPPHPPRIRKKLCLKLPCWQSPATDRSGRLELVRTPSARWLLLGCLALLSDTLRSAPREMLGGGRKARDSLGQANRRHTHGSLRNFIGDYASSRLSSQPRRHERKVGQSREEAT